MIGRLFYLCQGWTLKHTLFCKLSVSVHFYDVCLCFFSILFLVFLAFLMFHLFLNKITKQSKEEPLPLLRLITFRGGGAYPPRPALHSAKGGAVETGCSELYDVILVYFIILPPSTAPPSHCTPRNEYPSSTGPLLVLLLVYYYYYHYYWYYYYYYY